MTRCESYPLCSGTIYFPTTPSFLRSSTAELIGLRYIIYEDCYNQIIFEGCHGFYGRQQYSYVR